MATRDNKSTRFVLYAIWIGGMLILGIGAGELIVQSRDAAASEPTSSAVATANIVPAVVVSPTITGLSMQPLPATVQVTGAGTVYQAQAGNTFQTLSTQVYQPSGQPSELNPGFTNYVPPQGTVGTSPAQ
jgi:hypothetical protein